MARSPYEGRAGTAPRPEGEGERGLNRAALPRRGKASVTSSHSFRAYQPSYGLFGLWPSLNKIDSLGQSLRVFETPSLMLSTTEKRDCKSEGILFLIKISFWYNDFSFKLELMMKECQSEKNLRHCNCSYEPCSRKGVCCECLDYHWSMKELPACFFPDEVERTYDRSLRRFIQTYKGKV